MVVINKFSSHCGDFSSNVLPSLPHSLAIFLQHILELIGGWFELHIRDQVEQIRQEILYLVVSWRGSLQSSKTKSLLLPGSWVYQMEIFPPTPSCEIFCFLDQSSFKSVLGTQRDVLRGIWKVKMLCFLHSHLNLDFRVSTSLLFKSRRNLSSQLC